MTDRGPQPPDDRDEVDRRFREIIAGLEAPPAEESSSAQPAGDGDQPGGGEPPRPSVTEEETTARREPPATTPPPVPARPGHLGPGTPQGMATDHRSYEPPEEEDHFVPPRPAPLPAGDLHFWAILVGLVVGPVLVFLSAVVPVLDSVWTIVGALMTITGFVLLVLRQPRHRRDDDWGARV
jgi:hypothetical protein